MEKKPILNPFNLCQTYNTYHSAFFFFKIQVTMPLQYTQILVKNQLSLTQHLLTQKLTTYTTTTQPPPPLPPKKKKKKKEKQKREEMKKQLASIIDL